MNIQFYTWHSGNQIQTRQPDRSSETGTSETIRPGSYDRVSFNTQTMSASEDTSFARVLAKNVTGQVMAQHSPSPERIAELRRQISDGSYRPDDMAIARAMMER